MKQPRTRLLAAAIAATFTAMLGTAAPAAADSARARAQARKFHRLGMRALAHKNYAEATDKLSRAASIVKSAGNLTDLCAAWVQRLQTMSRPGINIMNTREMCGRALTASGGKPSPKLRTHMVMLRRIAAAEKARRRAASAASSSRTGRHSEAERKIREAIKLSPQPRFYFQLCRILAAQQKFRAAVASCNRVTGASRAAARAYAAKLGRSSSGGAAGPKARAALQAVSRAERASSSVDATRVGGARDLNYGITRTQQCVAAVAAARKAGVAGSAEVRVSSSKPYKHGRRVKKPGYSATHYAPVSEIGAGCRAKLAKLSVIPAKRGVEHVMLYVAALARNRSPGSHAWLPVKIAYDKCMAEVKRSIKLGAPATATFTAKTLRLTIADAATKGCGMATAAIARAKGAASAAGAAKFAPYKRVLRRDKWRVFRKYKMINFYVYGYRGRKLSSPRALARSSVWFEHLHSGSRYRWRMRRFKFNRHHRLVSTRTLSGRGKYPPSRAYR